jgi:lon-related putative ATP-dependent protease
MVLSRTVAASAEGRCGCNQKHGGRACGESKGSHGDEEAPVASSDFELTADQVYKACDPDSLGFETTEELGALDGSIGQERAMAAIDLGIGIKTAGYNVFAAGPTGTGRHSAVLLRAKEAARKQPAPDDWCYVYNFQDPRHPIALRLPAGRGPKLSRDIEELIIAARQEIPRAFESEQYEQRREEAVGDVQSQRNQLLRQLDEEARQQGLMIQATPMGIVTMPMKDGRPMSREEFEQLPEEERERIDERMQRLRDRIGETLAQARQLDKEARRRLEALDREVALFAIGHRLEEVKAAYEGLPKVVEHLQAVADDLIEHLPELRSAEPGQREQDQEEIPIRYRVNVLVTNAPEDGAPVVHEQSPTYYNLVGGLEYRPMAGGAVTDFTLIKAGAVHRANGGYLILRALDVLLSPFSWDALKRSLRSGEATIENIGEQWTPIPAAGLRPEPIPLDLKVILIGSPLLYFLLYHYDEEFGKLFKVKADFDIDMSATPESYREYAAFIASHCRLANLRHLDKKAAARVIDYGMRIAGDQEKLSARFAAISDLLVEANYWAQQEGADKIGVRHVDQALEQKEYRSRRIEDRLFEFIARGDLKVEVAGEALGQVNGLAVLDLGDYAFGRPSRITTRVTPGRSGVINIEREARLSGDIHHKAVMILTGYLAGMYAEHAPLSLSATLCFEQSYDLVEGDSASCAELYAILSSLADAPIRQSVAVTGSVDQMGNIQAVGGVNEKIEGFYTTCKLKGLTGDQGVVIPRQNVKNLMLKPEVVQAIAEGRFHVWAVSHVDEGIELLTGIPAGSPDQPDTIHGRAAARLKEFTESLRGAQPERTTHVVEGRPQPAGPVPPTPPTPPIPPSQPVS